MSDEPLKLKKDYAQQLLGRYWSLDMSKTEKRKVTTLTKKVLDDDELLADFLSRHMRIKVEIIK